MFAVFGVCKTHCVASAKKKTADVIEVEGRRVALTESEWEAAVAAHTEDMFRKAKPRKISSILTAKSAATEFKALAERQGEARALSVRRRDHLRRNGKVVLNIKTKKPRFTWIADA